MERVAGIGGVFFRTRDPEALGRWYAEHLGVDEPPATYEHDVWWQQAGPTVWAAFPEDADEVGPHGWMINFRVTDLDRMVAQLHAAGIDVAVDPEFYPNGRFASLSDPEGQPIQLWQPARRAAGKHVDGIDAIDVFFRHVERFNAGVETGDFSAMVQQFAPHAEMVFEGTLTGPYRSRDEIADAYRTDPPDDSVMVLAEPVAHGDTAVGSYGWRAHAGTRAGEMRVTVAGQQIRRLVVTFDRPMAG